MDSLTITLEYPPSMNFSKRAKNLEIPLPLDVMKKFASSRDMTLWSIVRVRKNRCEYVAPPWVKEIGLLLRILRSLFLLTDWR